MEYYVYILIDPRNGEPFYVGKGKDDRAHTHSKRYEKYNKLKDGIIKKISEEGLEVVVLIKDQNLEEKDALILEQQPIKEIGRRDLGLGPLANMTDGGDGCLGYKMDAEKRKEWRQNRIESGVYEKIAKALKGSRKSDETKHQMSIAATGRKVSDQTRKKMSILAQKPKSETHRINISNAKMGSKNPMYGKVSPMKGKTRSDETKEKIRQARKNQVISDETKKKMSESQKGKTWITDGKVNAKIKKGEPIPEGFCFGFTKKKNF